MVLFEAIMAGLGLTVGHQINQKLWRAEIKKLGLSTTRGVMFGGQGYELFMLDLLNKVARNGGWEAIEGYERPARLLQLHVVQPLKLDSWAAHLETGVLLRGRPAECEPLIRAMATEFNGNIVRVDTMELLNCFYVKSLFRVLKKLRPVIVVLDNADVILHQASGYSKAPELKTKLMRRWPDVEDRICLIAATNLEISLDDHFVQHTFRFSIRVSSQDPPSPPPSYSATLRKRTPHSPVE
ncbi:hypothetical protein M3Y99_01169100 [Aphelenchoides fujianensis]|nr:hypothetical protein M3Y99_01169100 [Aphelenchoides fujianensis]